MPNKSATQRWEKCYFVTSEPTCPEITAEVIVTGLRNVKNYETVFQSGNSTNNGNRVTEPETPNPNLQVQI